MYRLLFYILLWNVSLPPNPYVEAPIPSVMVLGGGALWKRHEGEALLDRVSAHKRDRESRDLSLPQVKTQQEVSCLQTTKRVLTRHQVFQTRTVGNKYWLF